MLKFNWFKKNSEKHPDDEKSELLRMAAIAYRKVYSQVKEQQVMLTYSELKRLQEEERLARNKFITQAYELCFHSVYKRIQREQFGWDKVTTIPLSDAFHDNILKAIVYLIKAVILTNKDISDYNFPSQISQKTSFEMIDQYRRLTSTVIVTTGDNELSKSKQTEQIDMYHLHSADVEEITEHLMQKFNYLVPNKTDRIFLRWYYMYQPGDNNIAEVFDFKNTDYVRVKRARLIAKLMKQSVVKPITAAIEISVYPYENELLEDVIDDRRQYIKAHLKSETENSVKNILKRVFKPIQEQVILIRWYYLLGSEPKKQANVYEFSKLSHFKHYRNKIINKLITEVSNTD